MYQLQIYDFLKDKWHDSVVKNYRYQPVRDEWQLRVREAKNAQMPYRLRIKNLDTGAIYDDWYNKLGGYV